MRKQIFESTAVKYDNDVLSPVITSLYRDPANVYIRYESMVLIATDKIAKIPKDLDAPLRVSVSLEGKPLGATCATPRRSCCTPCVGTIEPFSVRSDC